MQVIIPLAGKGTRLRPHTHLVPKPLLKVAGRPVMDWVMDRLEGLDVTELIVITGHLKEQVEAFARSRYRIPSRFIEQKVQDGTAGAVNLARPYVKGPVLIIFSTPSSRPTLRSSIAPMPTGSFGPRRSRTTSDSAWWSPMPRAT